MTDKQTKTVETEKGLTGTKQKETTQTERDNPKTDPGRNSSQPVSDPRDKSGLGGDGRVD